MAIKLAITRDFAAWRDFWCADPRPRKRWFSRPARPARRRPWRHLRRFWVPWCLAQGPEIGVDMFGDHG